MRLPTKPAIASTSRRSGLGLIGGGGGSAAVVALIVVAMILLELVLLRQLYSLSSTKYAQK